VSHLNPPPLFRLLQPTLLQRCAHLRQRIVEQNCACGCHKLRVTAPVRSNCSLVGQKMSRVSSIYVLLLQFLPIGGNENFKSQLYDCVLLLQFVPTAAWWKFSRVSYIVDLQSRLRSELTFENPYQAHWHGFEQRQAPALASRWQYKYMHCVCVDVFIYMYICVYIYKCIYIYTCIYIYAYACICLKE